MTIITYPTPDVVRQAVAWHFARTGQPYTVRHDWHTVRMDPEFQRRIAEHYDSLPEVDDRPEVHAAYRALAAELDEQYRTITGLGVRMVLVDEDAYENLAEAALDVDYNRQLLTLSTEATGGHPMLTNDENDKFRFVHDIFGHFATGRNFDRHGEEAAYQHHRMMFTTAARAALASETRGQNASLIINGDFGPQRAALMEGWAINE